MSLWAHLYEWESLKAKIKTPVFYFYNCFFPASFSTNQSKNKIGSCDSQVFVFLINRSKK